MKASFIITIGLCLGLMITGCSTEQSANENNNEKREESQSNKGEEKLEKESNVPVSEKSEENKEEQKTEEVLPIEKEIEVFVEGEMEMRNAFLAKSNLGYSIYVLDGFSLESSEPGKDIVQFKADSSFSAYIEPLDENVNYDELKENLLTIIEDADMIEENPETIYLENFRDAKFYLIGQFSDHKTTILYLAKEIEGQGYMFMIHMPHKEAAEGVGPSMWAMLSTIKPN
jgi:hypothetical protein